MKFKRFLAAMLSVLTMVSMETFTASAADNAETSTTAPVLERNAAGNSNGLKNCERGIATEAYDEENDIVYIHVVPNFEKASGGDNSIYVNMYGLNPAVVPQARTLYAVAYLRSNVAADSTAGFYQVKKLTEPRDRNRLPPLLKPTETENGKR